MSFDIFRKEKAVLLAGGVDAHLTDAELNAWDAHACENANAREDLCDRRALDAVLGNTSNEEDAMDLSRRIFRIERRLNQFAQLWLKGCMERRAEEDAERDRKYREADAARSAREKAGAL